MDIEYITWRKLIVSLIIPFLAAFVGSAFTDPSLPVWYAGLNKPFFNPPSWVFGPAWTVLYLLMGAALYLVWDKGLEKRGVGNALQFFSVQLALNALWSIVFFGLQTPGLAFIEILILWVFILLTTRKFYRISRRAGIFLLPYIIWVTFAAVLNFSIWVMNT